MFPIWCIYNSLIIELKYIGREYYGFFGRRLVILLKIKLWPSDLSLYNFSIINIISYEGCDWFRRR